jgi:hypothetical protein
MTTTLVGTTTLDGVISTITTTSTLNSVVTFNSEIQTLDGVVSEYPLTTTLHGVVAAVEPSYITAELVTITGFFLPTLLAVLLTLPVRTIDSAAKQLHPWHALTRPGDASAKDSLCLRTGGAYGIIASIECLAVGGGEVLIFLTTLLTFASIVLVPLSTEAVGLKLHGGCSRVDFRGCAMTLGCFLSLRGRRWRCWGLWWC